MILSEPSGGGINSNLSNGGWPLSADREAAASWVVALSFHFQIFEASFISRTFFFPELPLNKTLKHFLYIYKTNLCAEFCTRIFQIRCYPSVWLNFKHSLAHSIWELFSREHTSEETMQLQVCMCHKSRLLSELFSSRIGEVACKIPTPPYPSGDSSLNIALNMLTRTTQRPVISSCRLGCWMLSFDEMATTWLISAGLDRKATMEWPLKHTQSCYNALLLRCGKAGASPELNNPSQRHSVRLTAPWLPASDGITEKPHGTIAATPYILSPQQWVAHRQNFTLCWSLHARPLCRWPALPLGSHHGAKRESC